MCRYCTSINMFQITTTVHASNNSTLFFYLFQIKWWAKLLSEKSAVVVGALSIYFAHAPPYIQRKFLVPVGNQDKVNSLGYNRTSAKKKMRFFDFLHCQCDFCRSQKKGAPFLVTPELRNFKKYTFLIVHLFSCFPKLFRRLCFGWIEYYFFFSLSNSVATLPLPDTDKDLLQNFCNFIDNKG
ncbi:hypothetical protein BDC45DRAFT_540017 [Circinella umbellata]|nr:hypothetical protein BDC45DRAFT_540017 [Circinella umbellata]